MNDIICPNCRSVGPALAVCMHCYIPLPVSDHRATILAIGNARRHISRSLRRDDKVLRDLDPHLQNLVSRVVQQGIPKLPGNSTGTDEVAVIAKVTDAPRFRALTGLRCGLELKPVSASDQTTLMTARMPVQRVEEIRRMPFVTSLKAALRLRPHLDRTAKDVGATSAIPPATRAGGAGVVVGIVDFGMDFVHENFRNADKTSRVIAIWDQTSSQRSGPFGYGKVYRKSDIDAALKTADPYTTLGYGPAADSASGEIGAHGTHVADIAAGNGRGSSLPGIAPEADIVFVEASTRAHSEFSADAIGDSFADTAQLLEAISFIFDVAGDRPCVVNVSLGSNGGPHDGSTLVEEGIDRLIATAPNRTVIMAAGNSFGANIYASGKVEKGGFADLHWRIPSLNSINNEVEIWYSGQDRFTLEVIQPDGKPKAKVFPGLNLTHTPGDDSSDGAIIIANRLRDPNNGDNAIAAFLGKGLMPGTWTLRLHGEEVDDGTFHAWIERDDDNQSSFAPANPTLATNNSRTLNSISCGRGTIVVGAYDTHDPLSPLSPGSSSGPTRDGRNKPDISGPGHQVLAAYSRTQVRMIRKTGTSMAASVVTGVVALMLAEAKARNLPLTSDEIRDILIKTARKQPPAAGGQGGSPEVIWDPRYGYGRVSAPDAVAAVIALAEKSAESAS